MYAALLAALLAWSLVEVGLDWWPLAARLDVAFVLGLLLLLPPVGRPLAGPRSRRRALGGAVGLAAGGGGGGRPRPARGRGELPAAAQAPVAAAGAPCRTANGRPTAARGYGQRYSPLAQITPANVGQLQVAWEFHTGDLRGRPGDPEETTDEVTPLKMGNRLFLCTPHQSVIALDATTGASCGATTR